MSESSDFRLVRPLAVTDAILTSSTVPETTVTVWNSGTTYAAGQTAGLNGANNSQVVYESLLSSNTNHSPDVSPSWWKELGTVYGTWNSGTTYAADDVVTVTATHKLYRSVQPSNTNHAVTETAWWTDIGPTNRWECFDDGVATQTTQPDSMTMVFTPGQVVTTLAGLNAYGTSVTLTQSASGYSETQSLVSHVVDNWLDFFYEELVLTGDFAFDNIPPYPASTLTLTIENEGDVVRLGCCFIGKARTLGTTQWDLTGSSLSYSTTTTDDFGNVTIVPRNKAKRLNFDVYIPAGMESEAYRILTEYMDTPIVVIGARDYSMTITYCYLGQWEVPVTISGRPATIETRGLV